MAPEAGLQLGQALAAMERISATSPAGYSFEWTGTALEKARPDAPALCWSCHLFAYLFFFPPA
jgi:multidrug efflux pump subunit AcrB